jgi:hypothetical protein
MIILLLGLPIVLFALIESTIAPMPIVLLFIVSLGAVTSDRQIFPMGFHAKIIFLTVFLTGFLLDVLMIRPLGQTSVIFLVLVFLISLYAQKFTPTHLIFFAPMAAFSILIYQMIFQKGIALVNFTMVFILAIVIRFYVRYLFLRFVKPEQMKFSI